MRPAERRVRLATARLYVCTAIRADLAGFLGVVLAGGVDVIQLRDKDAGDDELVAASRVFRAAADRHDALFVLNDRPDLAGTVGADGVHVGQDDPDPASTRATVGAGVLIGRSTHTVEEVDRAQREDCDYFAVGPVSPTPTKPGRSGIGLEPIRHAAAVATKPWFVTGGMSPTTAGPVLDAGARRLVVVRALTGAADPGAVARQMAALLADR